MTLIRLNPNATPYNSGVLIQGAATVHAALSDVSDGTYVYDFEAGSDLLAVDFETVTLPAGARLKSIAPGYRGFASASAPISFSLNYGVGIWIPTVLGTVEQTLAAYDVPFSDSNQAYLDNSFVYIGQYSSLSRYLNLFKFWLTVIYVTQPRLTFVAPTADQSFTTQNTIRAVWTPSLDTDGGTQTNFQAKIFTEAVAAAGGFDPETGTPVESASGTTAASWQSRASLVNGNYRVYVKIAQTVNSIAHYSAWTAQRFVINATPPRDPGIVAVGENSNGRIAITLTLRNNTTRDDLTQIERSEDAGATWEPLRTAEGDGFVTPTIFIADTRLTVYDQESGNGERMLYRVRSAHLYTSTYVWTGWVQLSPAASWTSTDRWLKCPLLPAYNIKVDVWGYDVQEREARQGVHMPLSATYPIVISDTPGPETGEVQFLAETKITQDALDAISALGIPLQLQFLPTDGRDDIYLVLGARSRVHLVDKLQIRHSVESYRWTRVEKPS